MGMRDIEVFRVVMNAGSTSKAANVLGISQPAVSQAIRKLETSAGLALFLRVRGRLVPTQEAHALMVDVDKHFVGMDAIEHRIKSLKQFGTGSLAIAAHPAIGNAFMPRALAAFDLAQRDVRISLRVLSSREVHQEVSAGHCDFGLMADEMPVMGLEHSPFLDMPGVIAMPALHPLAQHKVITAQALSEFDFLALNPEDSSRRRLEMALEARGVRLNTRVETAYAHTLCEMALRGIGVGFVNPLAVVDFIDRGLVVRPFELPVNFTSLMLFRPGRPLADNARKLMATMRIQLAKDLKAVQRHLAR
ncbi:DNA-binding transcriptional regulator, LysR family [Pseudomonas sp. URIL14HWK12:I9]|nr:DNA-binding transcriptional LysR family regulator [Pseudomonas sp. URIL14HWK12:I12]PVZ27736.1 DNA-binding transcriptional LysR family regulator [Pseudomonas sp. URIL14HWK12:I10]PVZ38625.1 DNA-binding transcriptional LysR family regulator [Pseudomonas sp. URIL14HWK12:I11]SNZ02612.1 DNA-binding transcriptional regulator, LysR family [Pseudomonas sp. URIL14HWK12:I9]